MAQLASVFEGTEGKLRLLCRDAPNYALTIPTLGMGGRGTANMNGDVAPREMAELSKPWRSLEDVVKGRELYFEYLTEDLEQQVASFNFSFQKFRYLFVTGSLRSFPKARWVIFTPGGLCLRLYSFRSTI